FPAVPVLFAQPALRIVLSVPLFPFESVIFPPETSAPVPRIASAVLLFFFPGSPCPLLTVSAVPLNTVPFAPNLFSFAPSGPAFVPRLLTGLSVKLPAVQNWIPAVQRSLLFWTYGFHHSLFQYPYCSPFPNLDNKKSKPNSHFLAISFAFLFF